MLSFHALSVYRLPRTIAIRRARLSMGVFHFQPSQSLQARRCPAPCLIPMPKMRHANLRRHSRISAARFLQPPPITPGINVMVAQRHSQLCISLHTPITV
jgi:hypothetical protein